MSLLSIAVSILVDGKGFDTEKLYYLEGMMNAVNPIVKNIGKNLFDGKYEKLTNKQFIRAINKIRVHKGQHLTLKISHTNGGYDVNTFMLQTA